MRALVTGAGGFVGHHLLEHLASSGDEVFGADRADGSVDILDPAQLATLLGRVRPEVVYHLAGWSDVGGSWAAPLDTVRANVEGTLNVLAAARSTGVQRLLLVSSADVYGSVDEADLPIDESTPMRPVSPYAVSKVGADFLGLQAWLGHGQAVVRARAFNHIGPGQTSRFVAPALAERIAMAERDGSRELPVGNLSARRDFTDVRDVVRAYRLLVERAEPGEVYNVCSGTAVSIAEVADRLVALSGAPLHLSADPALTRPVDVPVLLGDPTRLRAATGWEPTIALDQTLADVLDEARRRVGSAA